MKLIHTEILTIQKIYNCEYVEELVLQKKDEVAMVIVDLQMYGYSCDIFTCD